MTARRLKPAARRAAILTAALAVARRPGGWSKLTRQAIAKEAGCSEALVSCYLGSIPSARKIIIRAAIKNEIVAIIIQSMAANDGYINRKWLNPSLKNKAISALLGK